VAQDKSTKQKPLQAVKLPDLSMMSDEEIDAYAAEIWQKFAGQQSQ
jgi:hypothetical protein